MHHSIIIRAAVGLTVFLCLIGIGFGWAATHRELQFETRSGGAAVAADAASGATAARAPAGSPPEAAREAFDARCAKCHEADEITEWLAGQGPQDREAALVAFLDSHGKAPPAVNRLVARYFAGSPAP